MVGQDSILQAGLKPASFGWAEQPDEGRLEIGAQLEKLPHVQI